MSYTKNELSKVSYLSALLFDKEEILKLMDENYGKDSFENAQEKGILQGEYEIRKALYAEAKDGDVKAIEKWNIQKNFLKN
ncbi:MAG TPA: hypothetical protein EYG94_00925 [Campylobacterales bacterium]|nr:hypothetical protein [Campylobacterales bacterium]